MNRIETFSTLRHLMGAVLALLGLLPAAGAAATNLPDPTRPPAALRRIVMTPAGSTASTPPAPMLQSVITGEGRKPAAIISGQLVELGDTFNGMRLTQLSVQGAVLTGPKGGTTLPLTPDSDKHIGAAAPQPRALERPTAAARPTVATVSLRAPEQK